MKLLQRDFRNVGYIWFSLKLYAYVALTAIQKDFPELMNSSPFMSRRLIKSYSIINAVNERMFFMHGKSWVILSCFFLKKFTLN